MIVIMAFLGNVFTPMSGLLLDLGRLTPLYGYAALARFPLTEGYLPGGGRDALWLPVANVLAWTIVFSLLALWGVRRSRART
jgi:ABC-2 type transport system permease protein